MSDQSEFIPFALPDLGDAEAEAVAAAVRSGWLTSGEIMKLFESDFTSHLGTGIESIAVNSATAGLHLSLEALGVGPGDEVIVPTWTFTATAEIVRYLGGIPRIVDVDTETLNICPKSVEMALTKRTRAVIPVHFAGLAADVHGIHEVIGTDDVVIVEDAAHALPTIGPDGLVGNCTYSAATVFSFYATKTLTTGEGGMITTRNPSLAERARIMRLHGIDRDAFSRYRSSQSSWFYDVVEAGYKYNMTDMSAALGRVQLSRLKAMRDRRQSIADYYLSEMNSLPLKLPAQAESGESHSWHLFTVRLEDESGRTRDDFIDRMASCGVGTSVHYRPLHEHSYWRAFAPAASELVNANRASSTIASLPIYSALTDSQVTRIVEAVHQSLRS